MNVPTLILTRNNLSLTHQCVRSLQSQSLPTELLVIDNDSTDRTIDWLYEESIPVIDFRPQIGVSAGWNFGLDLLFSRPEVTHVLVPNNDTFLPPWMLAELLLYNLPFVTGIAVDDPKMIERPAERLPLTPAPDFSCFLIRRDAWESIGRFDENMFAWASDCDYHIRGWRRGVPMMKANLPYLHWGSSTIRNSPAPEKPLLAERANQDREVFRSKWGCIPGEPAYAQLFSESKWAIDSPAVLPVT